LFRRVNRAERIWRDDMTEKAAWHIVEKFAAKSRDRQAETT
jgi:hypothetical protein